MLVRAVIYGMRQRETDVDRASVRFLMDEYILSHLSLVPLCAIHYVSNSTTKEGSFRYVTELVMFINVVTVRR